MESNKEMKPTEWLVCELSDEMEWSEFICEWNEQINERQWNGINQRRTNEPKARRQANKLIFSFFFAAGALRPAKNEKEKLIWRRGWAGMNLFAGYGPEAPLPQRNSIPVKPTLPFHFILFAFLQLKGN